MKTWMVRAEGGTLIEEFINQKLVAIGWGDIGDLSKLNKRAEVIAKYEKTYPEDGKGKTSINAGQLFRFRNEIKLKDRIVTYDPSERVYHVGTVTGDYVYRPTAIVDSDEHWPHIHDVEWEGSFSRDLLPMSARNPLGATLTVFLISSEAAKAIEKALKGDATIKEPSEEDKKAEEEQLLRDLQAQSHELIKDKLSKLDWEEMQELVAGLLRAMGYKTQVSQRGPDQGKDIVASPDGFGFEQPRIVVEVKHRKDSRMGAHEVRSFLGGRHKDDKGLYVSTGGFSKEARYEAERASIPITLMDLDKLVEAILTHYDKMDLNTRVLVPLTQVWWPA